MSLLIHTSWHRSVMGVAGNSVWRGCVYETLRARGNWLVGVCRSKGIFLEGGRDFTIELGIGP